MRSFTIISYLFVLLVLGVSSQALDNVEWVNGAGGNSSDVGIDVSISPSGDIYSVGEFDGPSTFGPDTLEGSGMFVSKMTPNGTWIWTVEVNNTVIASAISTDLDGNAYVIGTFAGTLTFGSIQINSSSLFLNSVFVAKIAPNATWMWAVTMDDNGNCTSVSGDIVVNATDIYIAGFYRETCLFGSTLVSTSINSPIIAKLDTDGIWLDAYLVTVSPGGFGIFNSISVFESFVYGVGWFSGNVTIASDVLVAKGTEDILIAKLNPQNTWIWGRRAGGNQLDIAEGVTSDENGNVYAAGSFGGSADFGPFILNSTNTNGDIFVAKLDSDGGWLWAVTNLNLNNLTTFNVAFDITTNVSSLFVAGRITGEYVFGPVMINTSTFTSFVASLNFDGNWTDIVVFTSDLFSSGNALDINNSSIYNTGIFRNTTQFSNFTLNATSPSMSDIYVLKIDLGSLPSPPSPPSPQPPLKIVIIIIIVISSIILILIILILVIKCKHKHKHKRKHKHKHKRRSKCKHECKDSGDCKDKCGHTCDSECGDKKSSRCSRVHIYSKKCCVGCLCCSICNSGNGDHNKGSRTWDIEMK